MPELPEVEAAVRYLRERLIGAVIADVDVRWDRTIATPSPAAFREALLGASVEEVFRRGKFIGVLMRRDSVRYLFIHLRMSGTVDVVSAKTEDDRHDRVVLKLRNGKSLRFNDTRKFGRMYLYESLETITDRLGLEPLSDEFTVAALTAILSSRRSRIKTLLLDQTLIAGLGNIYVDEALWKAQIHPLTPSFEISRAKVVALHAAIRATLFEAIELAGTDFGDGVVEGGMYRPKVYGRAAGPCHRCGRMIERLVVGQRGTHVCRRCQKPPRG